MNFSNKLWDQFPVVVKRAEEVGNYSLEIAGFFQKRAQIEKEYAQRLQKLVKTFQAEDIGSFTQGFAEIKEETEKLAKWHDEFGDKLITDVRDPICNEIREAKKQKKALAENGERITKDLKDQTEKRDKARSAYERARKKQDESQEEYEKASFTQQPPNVVQKLAKKVQVDAKASTKADEVYKQGVKALQESQQRMYDTDMPKVLNEFQSLEEQRLDLMRVAINKFISLQENLIDQVKERTEAMKQSTARMVTNADIIIYIEKTTTNKSKPEYAEYEPYEPSTGRCRLGADLSSRPNISDIEIGNPTTEPIRKSSRSTGSQISPVSNATASTSVSPRATTTTVAAATTTTKPAQPPSVQPVSPSKQSPRVRALFDYTGLTEHELSFKKGDIIRVVEKSDSGWWTGELSGAFGAFPSEGWVEEVSATTNGPSSSPSSSSSPRTIIGSPRISAASNQTSKKCKALFDFTVECPEEIEMKAGDILTWEQESGGWVYGTNQSSGKHGRFPANYVQLL